MEVYRKRVEYRLIDVALASLFFFLLCPINWINSFRSRRIRERGEKGRGRGEKSPPRIRNFSRSDRARETNLAREKMAEGKVGTKIWELKGKGDRVGNEANEIFKHLQRLDLVILNHNHTVLHHSKTGVSEAATKNRSCSGETELDEVLALCRMFY